MTNFTENDHIDKVVSDSQKKAKRAAAERIRRSANKAAYDSVGMVRVRGNLGGIYYE